MATFLTECFCANNDEKVRSIWRAGCALSLSYTGLGTVSWFDKAVTCVKKPAVEFLKSISVECFWTFIGYYISLTQRNDYTWIFCRLIEDAALSFLSVNSMPVETAFFVALAGPQLDINDEIWAIASLRKLSRNDVVTGFAMALGYTENRILVSWTGGVFRESAAFEAQLVISGMKCYRETAKRMAEGQKRTAQHEEALPRINQPTAPEPSSGGLQEMSVGT